MPYHLEPRLYLPLEREHEAWVIRGIEDYARATGLKCRTFAVSQTEEDAWGADEVIGFRAKVFGLQFKRPYVTGNGIFWEISPSSNQFLNVCNNEEIFYALPSFVNRELKYQALHHCIFWRPCIKCSGATVRGEEQLCLRRKIRQYRRHIRGQKMRWGDLAEKLFECTAGKRIDQGTNVSSVLAEIQQRLRPDERESLISGNGDTLFLVAIELPS